MTGDCQFCAGPAGPEDRACARPGHGQPGHHDRCCRDNPDRVLLASAEPAHQGVIRGFPVTALEGLPAMFVVDPAVRVWLRICRAEGGIAFICDPGWEPGEDPRLSTLSILADARDQAIIGHQRAVWETTHTRDPDGVWQQLPRLEWLPQSPGWVAYGDRHGYLISRGKDNRLRVTRWDRGGEDPPAEVDPLVLFAREVLDNSFTIGGVALGQAAAQAYEDGRSVVGVAGWDIPRSTRPPYYPLRADLEPILDWRVEEAFRP